MWTASGMFLLCLSVVLVVAWVTCVVAYLNVARDRRVPQPEKPGQDDPNKMRKLAMPLVALDMMDPVQHPNDPLIHPGDFFNI